MVPAVPVADADDLDHEDCSTATPLCDPRKACGDAAIRRPPGRQAPLVAGWRPTREIASCAIPELSRRAGRPAVPGAPIPAGQVEAVAGAGQVRAGVPSGRLAGSVRSCISQVPDDHTEGAGVISPTPGRRCAACHHSSRRWRPASLRVSGWHRPRATRNLWLRRSVSGAVVAQPGRVSVRVSVDLRRRLMTPTIEARW